MRGVQDHLGVSGEGETEDKRVTLKYNTCLGTCSQAPAISVDHRLIGRLTPESATELVAGLVSSYNGGGR